MDRSDFSITRLAFSEQFDEYHGFIRLLGRDLSIHFPLNTHTPVDSLLRIHGDVLGLVNSQIDSLIAQAVFRIGEAESLPEVSSLIVYDDGTFDFHFGNSKVDDDERWCEAMYENNGNLHHFEIHVPKSESHQTRD